MAVWFYICVWYLFLSPIRLSQSCIIIDLKWHQSKFVASQRPNTEQDIEVYFSGPAIDFWQNWKETGYNISKMFHDSFEMLHELLHFTLCKHLIYIWCNWHFVLVDSRWNYYSTVQYEIFKLIKSVSKDVYNVTFIYYLKCFHFYSY